LEWRRWKPKYERISKELELDEKADRYAAKTLNVILPNVELRNLKEIIEGQVCVVFGAGPSLEEDALALSLQGFKGGVVIAADGATSVILQYRAPDIVVTDLDGDLKDLLQAWRLGSWLVVHAHGDNLSRIHDIAHDIRAGDRVIGTTQVKPFGKLFNFGGFTDGDRAAFLAHELGASRIYLAGMDLGRKIGEYSGSKNPRRTRIKLRICKELLSWLAKDLKANLVNLTSKGEPIPNVPKESL